MTLLWRDLDRHHGWLLILRGFLLWLGLYHVLFGFSSAFNLSSTIFHEDGDVAYTQGVAAILGYHVIS